MIKKNKFLLALAFLFTLFSAEAAGPTCPNKFPDFINDVCWSCVMPMRLFGATIARGSGEDFTTASDSSPVCLCINKLAVGVPTSFWEMAYIVDVHTAPGCLPTVGGLTLPVPWVDNQYGTTKQTDESTAGAFQNSAYYVSPMMYLLEAVLDDSCSDRSSFDVGWTSEFDPTWNDDSLALIKMPIGFAFGSLPAILAAGPDAAAALVGFPFNEIFWQAGSWGPIYPLTGTTPSYKSMDTTGHMIATKMLAEAHAMREMAGLFMNGAGRSYACEPGELGCTSDDTKAAMCSTSPSSMPTMTIMKKRQYKLQRLFPSPATKKQAIGGCCSPIGRSTVLSEVNTQLPVDGYKDFGYAVFRKRDCCASVLTPTTP